MRPIDADALRTEWLENGENEYVYDTNAVLDSIDNALTIDLEPVRRGRCEMCDISEAGVGKRVMFTNGWIVAIRKKRGKYALVINHEGEQIAMPIAFCPNCGARMDLEECE